MGNIEQKGRRHWMGVLARATLPQLEQAWETMPEKPDYRLLRGPETGLVMVQSRMGGTGRRFNLGEMTVTRCTVLAEEYLLGQAMIAGRDCRKAERAAVMDAMLQDPGRSSGFLDDLIASLERDWKESREKASRKTAATKVDFFTMVRGD